MAARSEPAPLSFVFVTVYVAARTTVAETMPASSPITSVPSASQRIRRVPFPIVTRSPISRPSGALSFRSSRLSMSVCPVNVKEIRTLLHTFACYSRNAISTYLSYGNRPRAAYGGGCVIAAIKSAMVPVTVPPVMAMK